VLENIYVNQWGATGPRVVMVHGGAQGTSSAGHRNFREQEPLGGQGWQLVVPDRPGHGQSPNPGRPDSAEDDSLWVADLLGDGAHLLGHSFGGLVALFAAGRRPEAVRSLTLIEPALLQLGARAPAVRKVLLSMALTMVLPYSKATKAKRVMKLLGIPDEFALSKNDHDSLGGALGRAKFPPKKEMRRQVEVVAEHRIPLLILSGSSSPAFIATGEIVAEMAGGRHVVTPAEHHFPQWAGAPFNAILADFWRSAEAR
jgi:pimeloyl-ACP methyl ester carboxylesterase